MVPLSMSLWLQLLKVELLSNLLTVNQQFFPCLERGTNSKSWRFFLFREVYLEQTFYTACPVEFRQKKAIKGKNLDKDILYTVEKIILCRLRKSTGSKFLPWAKISTAKSLQGGKIEKCWKDNL